MDYLHLTLRTTRLLRLLSTLHGMLLSFFIFSLISSDADDIPSPSLSLPSLTLIVVVVVLADENDASAWPAQPQTSTQLFSIQKKKNKGGDVARAYYPPRISLFSSFPRYGADALSWLIVMLAYQLR